MADELDKEIASDKSSDKPTGEGTEVNGSIADIDFSDVPENIREAVKAKVASKAKSFQSDYSKKTGELATLRKKVETTEANLGEWMKLKDALDKNPDLAKILNQTWLDFDSGKIGKSTVIAGKGLKLIDTLIDKQDNASVDGRQNIEDLRQMREIVKEESGRKDLEDKITKLENQLSLVQSTTRLTQVDRVNKGMENLDVRFGKDVIDKYREDIKTMSLKYPNQTTEKIFLQLADDLDIRTAFLNEAKAKERTEIERKKRGLEPSGDSFVGEIEKPKTKEGRVDMKKFIGNIVQKRGLGKGL